MSNLKNGTTPITGRYSAASMMDESGAYRMFRTENIDGAFVITEMEPVMSHPLNWLSSRAKSRVAVWLEAQSQKRPVLVQLLDGTNLQLGVVFDQEVANSREYSSFVSQCRADSDAAFFAPISYESWLASGKPKA